VKLAAPLSEHPVISDALHQGVVKGERPLGVVRAVIEEAASYEVRLDDLARAREVKVRLALAVELWLDPLV